MKEAVKNVPNYAWEKENPFWVATEDGGEFWFYGAYETRARANEVASMYRKVVIAD